MYCKMFFIDVSDTLRKAAFISSMLAFFFTMQVISVSDPSATGTRIPAPPIFPLSSGNISVSAFAAPAAYTFGDAGRTFGAGPGFFNVDGAILKEVSVAERFAVQFRVEAMNLTNHANFANPNTEQGSGTFGQITALAAGEAQARVIQFGLHLKF